MSGVGWRFTFFTALVAWILNGSASVAPNKEESVRVLTFNIRYDAAEDAAKGHAWRDRLPAISAVIAQVHPDILALQEVLPSQHADLRGALGDYTRSASGL